MGYSFAMFIPATLVLAVLVLAGPTRANDGVNGSKMCKPVKNGRAEWDPECSKYPDMVGCNAGGQLNCRYCGFSVYHACPGKNEAAKTPLTTNTALFEGDILLIDKTPTQFIQSFTIANDALELIMKAGVQNDAAGEFFRNAIKDRTKLWPNGVVYYQISNDYTNNERNTLLKSMRTLEQYTCIRFVQRTNQNDYINIYRGEGCSSYIGRYGGMQPVSLGYGCIYLGTAMHEFLHALGFYHEQSRADRDDFVNIYWQNIISGMEFNFQKYTLAEIDHLGQPYDYASLMHYDKLAFSKDGASPTILAKQEGVDLIHAAYKTVPTSIDAKKVNLLYQCPETVVEETTEAPKTTVSSTVTTTLETTTTRAEQTTSTPKKPGCKNIGSFCSDWAKAGDCATNPLYMSLACQQSCNTCDPGKLRVCQDFHEFCPQWHTSGECEKSPEYMRVVCPMSCGRCSSKCKSNENSYEPEVTYMELHSPRFSRAARSVYERAPKMPSVAFLRLYN